MKLLFDKFYNWRYALVQPPKVNFRFACIFSNFSVFNYLEKNHKRTLIAKVDTMDVKKALVYQRQAEINKKHQDMVNQAQERLVFDMEGINQLKRFLPEEHREHETIRLILKRLKQHRATLTKIQMICPHTTAALAIQITDILIAGYEKPG